MQRYQREFVELALAEGALKFGNFTLKSGRVSPYFFNAGEFSSGNALATLGKCYAQAIVAAEVEFDLLFGPAYKGIPLAASAAIALAEQHQRDLPYCFNRKEAKRHGEGGELVGAEMTGKVLIVDDVITAGTAIRESVGLIRAAGAEIAGVVVGLDRKERGAADKSAVQEVEQEFGCSVISIVEIATIIEYLQLTSGQTELVEAISEYRKNYGI